MPGQEPGRRAVSTQAAVDAPVPARSDERCPDGSAGALHDLYLVMLAVALAGTVLAFPAGTDRLVAGVATAALAGADIVVRRRVPRTGRRVVVG